MLRRNRQGLRARCTEATDDRVARAAFRAIIRRRTATVRLPVVPPVPVLALTALTALVACAPAFAQDRAVADADTATAIATPLAGPGDAARGRALLAARDPANCILCHAVESAGIRVAGNLAPALDGIGARLSPAQLRARIVDSSRINPQTIMPSYFRTEGLVEVAAAYRGKTILGAQQVEDLVVYLSTLR